MNHSLGSCVCDISRKYIFKEIGNEVYNQKIEGRKEGSDIQTKSQTRTENFDLEVASLLMSIQLIHNQTYDFG